MKFLRHLVFTRTSQVLIDIVVLGFSWIAAYVARFEGLPPRNYLHQMVLFLPCLMFGRILLFHGLSVYKIVWRYISVRDASLILEASAPVTLVMAALRYFAPDKLGFLRVPVSVILIDFLLAFLGICGVRLLRKLTAEDQERERLNGRHEGRTKKVLLVGAGDAGNLVLKELKHRVDLGIKVVGFIDDDKAKLRKTIQGVRVLGNGSQIPELADRHDVQELIITIANASSKDISRIVTIAEGARLKVKIVPGLFEMFDEKVRITKLREINIDDLLGRSVFQLEKHLPEVSKFYKDKKILVTGAGGSIGSELCRQLAAIRPKDLILLDKDENSIFEIDTDLSGYAGNGTIIHPVIANIKNYERLQQLFEKYRPEVVFHAAAHKHVPLMERNVSEAILNNVYGTRNVVQIAERSGVERFIFISTDKAVNPTSVMGATKKIGEIIVQQRAKESSTRFSCVRFGNVLGSRGSAVPLFQKQIARGGPVTVTHAEMRRYFMSISEAVHLIIQAGTLGERGEVFVLDMGQPIRILDMVKTLIRLSGYKEDEIEIKFIGKRPGEKLYEEILIDEERTNATKFEKIFIAPPIDTVNGDYNGAVDGIIDAARAGDREGIVRSLSGLGIGFHRIE